MKIIPSTLGLTSANWLALLLLSQPTPAPAALQFNGTNSYATMNQSFLNGATVTNFSIEFWVKNSRPSINQDLCGKTEHWKGWGIGFYAGGAIHFMQTWPNTYYTMTTPTGVLKSNQWQHVAVVGQGTLGSIYVDGVLVHEASALRGEISFNAVQGPNTIAGFGLGFRDNGTLPDDLWFQGDVADFRIWDVALSATQVASVHAMPPAINTSGLRHWIPFNETSGTVFTDIIVGLQGQVFNKAWGSPPFCTPHAATATLFNGFVVGATITDPGCGYTNAPTVLIQGGGGTGATATAVVSNGRVTAINITSAGCCYTNVPQIKIGSPPFVPSVSIAVSKVNVTQHVVLGRNYVLEASHDLATWTPTGPPFLATDEIFVSEFDVAETGRFFRLREVP